jgi:hypothetical protein
MTRSARSCIPAETLVTQRSVSGTVRAIFDIMRHGAGRIRALGWYTLHPAKEPRALDIPAETTR